MSIQTEINRISQSKVDIVSALEYQEVNVPTNTTIDEIAPLIRQISRSEDLSAELNTQGTLLNTQTGKISDAINLLKGKAVSSGGEISLQEKTVSPSKTTQLVTPDSDYDGLSKVTVNAVTSSIDSNITASNIKSGVSILGVEGTLEEGITPSGTLEITENGTYDVTEYASANVTVASSGGDAEDHLDDFLTNTLTAIDSDVTKIVSYGSYGRTALTTVNLPKCTDIGSYAFRGCSGITNVNAPLVTNIATYGFYGCSKLANINMPNVSSTGTYAFYKCDLRNINFPYLTGISQNAFYQNENLQIADFGVASKINQAGFANCGSLVALILRRTSSICTLGVATNGFTNTPIAEGTGYVYVPRDLVDTYKTATNWVNYATQFRALEDYTVDGTITGALDETKI